jgi:cell division protein FtsQ
MARNNGPLIPDEGVANRSGSPASTPLDDSATDPRFLDLDSEEQSPFLRAQKRVPVRRGPIPKKAASRIKIAAIILAVVVALGGTAMAVYSYSEKSWRFRLDSSDQLEVVGIEKVTRRQVMDVLGGDIGKNVFFIPLDERKKQLEEIPWVESAAVARLLPNRLRVTITERTPMAFVQMRNRVALIDQHGVVMDLPPRSNSQYSFPVLVGMGDQEPLSTRSARMKIYSQLVNELDEGGTNYSRDLSEVDLSDPEDVKITVSDPNGEVLVHLGSGNFADRFKIYKGHVQEWRQQVDKLASVDLRYDRQVIVNPDSPQDQPRAVAAAMKSSTPPAKTVAGVPKATAASPKAHSAATKPVAGSHKNKAKHSAAKPAVKKK